MVNVGRSVAVLSAEDVVVDRLHQFVAGGHADVAEQGSRSSPSKASTTPD